MTNIANQRPTPCRKKRMGDRMIDASLITTEECEYILAGQNKLKNKGKWSRFGELAVHYGFCTTEQVEALPHYLGDTLVELGILTEKQKITIVKWHKQLRQKNINILLGELLISEGLCTKEQIDAALNQNTIRV